MTVVYEDNHIIVVNKTAPEIVQADKTGIRRFRDCETVSARSIRKQNFPR